MHDNQPEPVITAKWSKVQTKMFLRFSPCMVARVHRSSEWHAKWISQATPPRERVGGYHQTENQLCIERKWNIFSIYAIRMRNAFIRLKHNSGVGRKKGQINQIAADEHTHTHIDPHPLPPLPHNSFTIKSSKVGLFSLRPFGCMPTHMGDTHTGRSFDEFIFSYRAFACGHETKNKCFGIWSASASKNTIDRKKNWYDTLG